MSQVENGPGDSEEKKQQESDQAPEDDSSKPKTKSYAEILKGFEEIEKIFKRDQDKS